MSSLTDPNLFTIISNNWYSLHHAQQLRRGQAQREVDSRQQAVEGGAAIDSDRTHEGGKSGAQKRLNGPRSSTLQIISIYQLDSRPKDADPSTIGND